MSLKTIRLCRRNDVNDIMICEDTRDPAREKHTVVAVRDHEVVRRLIEIYSKADYLPKGTSLAYVSSEGRNEFVFPYVKERPLSMFYMGETLTLPECEQICRNLVIACMSAGVPWPVLYLMLEQGQIHLAADLSVYLSYMIDFTELDEEVTEKDCVVACAKLLLHILEPNSKNKANSYVLLQKKSERKSYERFMELYRDVDLAAVPKDAASMLKRARIWFYYNKDRLFTIFLVLCMALLVFTVVSFITNALFGEVPWLRLFINSFEKIGLESLIE